MIYDGHRGDFIKKNLTFNQDNFIKLFYDARAFRRKFENFFPLDDKRSHQRGEEERKIK